MKNKRRMQASLVVLFAGCCVTGARAADTIQAVEKELLQKWQQVDSMIAKIERHRELRTPDGTVRKRAAGTYEFLKLDGRLVYRVDMSSRTTNYLKGNDTMLDVDVVSIHDGQFVYTVTEIEGETSAVKTTPTAAPNFDLKWSFAEMHKDHVLTLNKDADIEGEPVYVIQAKPMDRKTFIDRQLYYYSKETGALLKTETIDNDRRVIIMTEYTDIKINVGIPAERFVFHAPPGVRVTDLTDGKDSR